MEWVAAIGLAAGLFAAGFAVARWWLPILLAAPVAAWVLVIANSGPTYDSDGIGPEFWAGLIGTIALITVIAPAALGVIAGKVRRHRRHAGI